MSLIEDIQADAVDSNGDLGAVLRKCKLLAARLGSQPLEDWLVWESNGYPEDVEVPDYRKWPLEVKGHFSGPFGSGMRNAPIPSVCLPKGVRESYSNYECRQSISSIEKMIKGADGSSTLHVNTGDLAVALGQKVYRHQNCVEAWAEFGAGNLLELLNTVRNMILDFSIAVWKEDPMAGDTEDKETIEPSKVTQIFNTTVYGGSANLVGASENSSVVFNVIQNNLQSLEDALEKNNVSQKDIELLKEALQEEQTPELEAGFGPKVSEWIGRMVKKAADGSWNVGVGAAGGILAQIISKYYGL